MKTYATVHIASITSSTPSSTSTIPSSMVSSSTPLSTPSSSAVSESYSLTSLASTTAHSSLFSPTTTSNPNQNDNQATKRRQTLAGIITGAVLGGLILIALLCLAIYYTYRRYHYRPRRSSIRLVLSPTPTPMGSVRNETFILSSFSPAPTHEKPTGSPLVMVYVCFYHFYECPDQVY